MFGVIYKLGPPEKPLIGAPHYSRADEWAFETPAILNEVLRSDPFDSRHSYVGDHRAALIANLPLRHFSTLFRPQFWPFFVFPVGYAYAAYWQMKALILVTGVFTLLLLLTRCTWWSIAGTLWYFFSACLQWCYSWPSALPEMVGSLCLCVVFACYLTIGTRLRPLILAGLGLLACSINFALCAYLPHLVPLAWIGLIIFVSWSVAQHQAISQRSGAVTRTLVSVGLVVVLCFICSRIYHQLRTTLTVIASTEYPGTRHLAGGTLPIQVLASHFFQWSETETHIPAMLGNICEGSGFLWLAPVTLFIMDRLRFSRVQKAALAGCWICFLMILCWIILPLPASIGHILGFDRTGGSRCLPALGLANIAIVSLCMSARNTENRALKVPWEKLRPKLKWLWKLAGASLIVLALLVITNQTLGTFFSWTNVLVATSIATVLIILLLERRRVALALALVVPQAIVFGAVNPVERGLSVVTNSPLYRFIHNHSELLQGRWLVYSGWIGIPAYLAATGCDVYTGIRYLPDIDHFASFAAAGLPLSAFNRSGILIATALPANAKTSVEVPIPSEVVWKVSPTDPLLKQIGITYVAFDYRPPPEIASHLIPLTSEPITGVWLYKLK